MSRGHESGARWVVLPLAGLGGAAGGVLLANRTGAVRAMRRAATWLQENVPSLLDGSVARVREGVTERAGSLKDLTDAVPSPADGLHNRNGIQRVDPGELETHRRERAERRARRKQLSST